MPECLEDRNQKTCKGPIEFRFPMSGTGRSFPRCEHHFSLALKDYERVQREYAPFSDMPPAGVSWAEWSDDY